MNNTIVIIPARIGSKGLPKKNIKILGDKPLLIHTVNEARKIISDSLIYVSTDSTEIKSIVESSGLKVPILRPKKYATDKSSARDVILHILDFCNNKRNIYPETVVYLQPTSPFRKSKHITQALKLYKSDYDMVVSVKKSKSNPYFNLYEQDREGFLKKSKNSKYTRRQDSPKVWEFNGAIYIINVKSIIKNPLNKFEKIMKYEMDDLSSIDIDDELDFKFANLIYKDLEY